MNIIYNGLLLSRNKVTGVERFSRDQLRSMISLLKNKSDTKVIILTNEVLNLKLPSNFIVFNSPIISQLSLFIFLPVFKFFFKSSVFISPLSVPSLFTTKHDIYTVHDVAWKIFPEHFPLKNKIHLSIAHFLLSRLKCKIHCVSNSTKNDFIKFYKPRNSNRIRAINPGLFSEDFQRTVWNFNSEDILFVGTLQRRKNLKFLIDAMKYLPNKFKLHIIGASGWFFDKDIKDKSDRIIFHGYVDDAIKNKMVSNAYALILPSLYEGWGYPVAESLMLGTPVITPKNSSLLEVNKITELQYEDGSLASFIKIFEKLCSERENIKNLLDNVKNKFDIYNFSNNFYEFIQYDYTSS